MPVYLFEMRRVHVCSIYLRNIVTPVACKSLAMPFQDLMIWYLSRVVREHRVSITETLRIHFRWGDRLRHGLAVLEIFFRISSGSFFSTGLEGCRIRYTSGSKGEGHLSVLMDSVHPISATIQIVALNESFKATVLIIVNLTKVDDDESRYKWRNIFVSVYSLIWITKTWLINKHTFWEV